MSNKPKIIKKRGVRYTNKILRKYFSKKYPTYQSAKIKSREVFNQLSADGKKVTVRNVFFIVRKHRAITFQKVPELFDRLTNPEPYFELTSYPFYIKATTNEIVFVSDLFNPGVEKIEGGQNTTYNESFSKFVSFGNKYSAERGLYESSDIDMYVVCTPPEKGTGQFKDKWVSKIITVDSGGHPSDFGYSPDEDVTITPDQKKTRKDAKKARKEREEQLQPPQPTLNQDVEKLRQENIKVAMQLFSSGQITKVEFKEMISLINKV